MQGNECQLDNFRTSGQPQIWQSEVLTGSCMGSRPSHTFYRNFISDFVQNSFYCNIGEAVFEGC